MIELFIEKQRADISEDFSTMLSYAIDDIRDFGAKNTSFSKTIILPGTKRNNVLFGHLFQVDRTTQYNPLLPNFGYNYNAAVSAEAIIFSDNLQVFKGILRIMQINYDHGAIEYEASVFGELGGFVLALGNYKLTANTFSDGTPNTAVDLDFSAHDHEYSIANIVASWDNDNGGNGYYYPVLDYGTYGRDATFSAEGKQSWKYKTLRPALFVKEYIEKIFAISGYSYNFPLMETDRFKRLIVPHNTKDLQVIGTSLLNSNVIAGLYDISLTDTDIAFDTFTGTTDWNTGFGQIAKYTGTPTVESNIKFHISGTYIDDGTGNDPVEGFYFDMRFHDSTGAYKELFPTVSIAGTGGGPGPVPFVIEITLPGYVVMKDEFFSFKFNAMASTGANINITEGYFSVDNIVPILLVANLGDTITINTAIPRNFLQKDFFSSIVKLFNLYVYEDIAKGKHLKVTPFVDFFAEGKTIDWTTKIDRSKPFKIKPMSELNSRYYEFNFANDSDFYNDLYKKRYNENYGSIRYDSGYEFASESNKTEIIFSGTPLVGYFGEDKVYSTIFKSSNDKEERIDSNIRILQAKKITGVADWSILNDFGTGALGTYDYYGYAGHYDDPNAPSNDIQFGVPKELFFTLVTGALNVQQFNLYYSDYMAEITDKDSKLLSANFRFNREDIAGLDFSKLVYIDGNLYRLNKVIDYNASAEDACQVELLKVINLNYNLSVPGNFLLTEDGIIISCENDEDILIEF